MHSRLKSIQSGNFFFQPGRLHLQPADLLVQLRNQGVLLLDLAAAIVGEQVRRPLQQPPPPLPHLRRMHTKRRHQLARRAVAPHRRQRHLRLHTRLDPSSFRSHIILPSLHQSYHDLDLKSWSSFLGPPLRKVQSETAQTRKSAVYMALAPAFILVMYYFVDPENTTALFTEPMGQLLLVVAAVLNVIAYFWARVILNPDI